MRIVGGRFRGLTLADVGSGDPTGHLRPTTDRVRENMFNLLTNGRHGNLVESARVLDLFAGTGALGLEALSRGASFVEFVENGRPALRLLRQNIKRARVENDAAVLAGDAFALKTRAFPPCDLVLLDPPYGKDLAPRAMQRAADCGLLSRDAVLVTEDSAAPAPVPGFEAFETRKYGKSYVTLWHSAGTAT